jgi:hypothetical protein
MIDNVDNVGWATLGTVVGLSTAVHELKQFATAMLTLTVGIVVAHFLKRALNYYYPNKKRDKEESN